MVHGGGQRVRRYRAAVYMQCASERDVDRGFDLLIEMMLSDRREDYLWGVLMDLAPSSLFRTFGDYEIEARVRYRFDRLCAEYGECGRHFVRMNLATQRSRLLDGLERLKNGLDIISSEAK